MTRTEKIADFVVNLRYEDIPPEAIRAAQNMVLDSLGCGIGTPHYNVWKATTSLKVAKLFGEKPESTCLVSGEKLPAMWAGFYNCILCHGIDFDDTHKAALTHTGAPISAGCLAVAEAVGASGKEFIAAVVAGYEVAVRVGMAVMPSHYNYWHSTATNCTFGVAAAAAKLYGCDADGVIAALGLAGTSASGLMAYLTFGDYTKSFNPAKTVQNGIMCGAAPSVGATAAVGMLDDKRGYCYAYCPDGHPKLDALVEGLGTTWEIIGNVPKFYPCLTASHAPIEAVLTCMKNNNLKKEDVKKITLRTYETIKTHFSNKELSTDMGARLSVPYCMSAAAVTGKVDMESFTDEMIFSPEIKSMLEKIEVVDVPELTKMYPEKFPSEVTIETSDGGSFSHSVYYPKGDLLNPYTQEELRAKFKKLASFELPEEKVNAIIEICENMDKVTNIRDILPYFVR